MPYWNGTADISRGARKLLLTLLALWIAGAAYASPADDRGGAVIEVGDGVVETAEDGMCSLVEAFENADASGPVHADCEPGSASADTIVLSPGSLYTLTAIHNNDAGPTGLPSVTTQILVEGNGAVIERSSGGVPFRLLHVGGTGDLTLADLTLHNGLLVDPADTGAGILNDGTLSASQVTIQNNTNGPDGGGAIANAGELTVTLSTLRNNGGPGSGAGILNAVDATATVTHSTLTANGCGGPGCGIHNEGTLTVINSTLSGTSGPLANGVNNAGTAVLEHVTMAGNTGGMPHSFLNSGQATLRNTMIAGDVDDIDSCSGAPVVFEGANLIEDDSCGCATEPGCLTGDPLLGALGDNGGPTGTHALSADSIAVDAADGVFCPEDDQRGVSRPQGDDCDIGAFELEVPAGEPELVFDPASLDFGDVVVGTTSAPQSATLQNTGDGGATGLNFADISSAGYDVDSGDCDSELPAGDSCEVVITFTPPGEAAFTLSLAAIHDGGPPGLLALSGNGIPPDPPAVTVDPASLEATLETGQSMPLELTIGNTGDATLDWEVLEEAFQIPGDTAQFSGNVLAVQEWDNGNGPALYIGGAFADIDGAAFGGVARWDGVSWQPLGTGVSGITRVETLTVFDGDLIAGGNFTSAGGEPAFRVARWDGNEWTPVGTGTLATGMNNTVNALAVYNGDLIAGGTFTSAGGQTVNRVARWDGSAWVPMGGGMDQVVNALAVFDGELIAAGRFTQAGVQLASRVARWNGEAWSPLGAGVDNTVLELAVFDGELIAGGLMSTAGGVPAENIARWDGQAWSALADGFDGTVRALGVFDGALIAGGHFEQTGSTSVSNIARWDGSEWSPLGMGIHSTTIVSAVEALTAWDGRLVAGGNFDETGSGIAADNIAVWDDNAWMPMAEGESITCELPDWVSVAPLDGTIPAQDEQIVEVTFDATAQAPGDFEANLCIGSNDPEQPVVVIPLSMTVETAPGQPELVFDPVSLDFGDIVVGTTSAPQSATLQNAGDGGATGLNFADISSAGYDVDSGDCDSELPAGDSCEVVITFTPPGEAAFTLSLAAIHDGGPPGLLALSGSGTPPDPPAVTVDPESVSASVLQGDLEIQSLTIANAGDETLEWFIAQDLSQFGATVRALTVWDDGDGPALYVGGSGSSTFDSDFNGIARWDGEEWSLLGTGIGGTGLVEVSALTVFDDALIVGGTFTTAGGVTVNRIARWNGEAWSPLGSGLDGRVNALAVFDGELIVGGQFEQAGDVPVSRIARWDGNSWSPLDSGLNSSVNGLTVHDGALIAAGTFTDASGTPASRVARWDGEAWSPLGLGVGTTVNAVTVFDGDLIVTGFFLDAGGAPANRIARWDGEAWFPLGEGLGSLAHELTVFEDTLIVGGAFTEAGGMPASRIARWDGEEWSPIGAGFLNPVRGLTVFDGDLIAGGSFTQPGTPPASRIARWDGNEWSAMVTDPATCALPDWLSVDPDEGEVEGGDEQTLSVIIDTSGLELGDYQTELCIVNTDQSSAVVTVPVELSVTAAPEADVSPEAFAFQLPPDGSAGDVLNIANIGASDLVWSIEGDNPDDLVVFDDIDYTVPASQWGGTVRWDTGETCDGCQNPPYNFNVWLTATTNELAFFWPGQTDAGGGGVTLDDGETYAVLERGAAVGQHSEFFRHAIPDATVHWRDPQNIDGYLGFRFVNPDTTAVNFGYARITTTGTTGHPATVVSWVYDQTGNPIAVEGCDDPADIPWLSISDDGGTTPPDQSSTVDVNVDATGMEPGDQQAQLCVATNDPAAPLVAIPIDLTVLGPEPIADIDPAAFEFEVSQGQNDADMLNIGNIGLDDLEWSIETAGRGTGGTDVLADGGFEAGTPNPSWEEGSTNFNTPLCDAACGVNGARSGNWWAWFGGTGDADESAFLAQEVIIPPTDEAQLRFWLHIDSAFTPGTLEVSLDDEVLFSATDADASDFPVYTEVVVDVTAFADGQAHALRFESETQAGEITNFFVDDVSLLIDVVDIGCDNPIDISWLDVDPAAGTTPPGGNVPVDVMVDAAGLEAGEYQAQLCVTTNDPEALLVEIPVTLEVPSDPPPQIEVDPASLSATVPAGQTDTQPLTINNLGVETLKWQITEDSRGASVTPVPDHDARRARGPEATPPGLEPRLLTTHDPLPATDHPHGSAAATTGIVDCENAPGIIIHDDGTAEDGYSLNPDTASEATFVEPFTPGDFPATFTALCVAFTSLGPTSQEFEIVAFADDGPDGGPGTELGMISATAEDIPIGVAEVAWSSFDISSLDLSVDSGSVYLGVRWATGTDVFVVADQSSDNPVGFAGGFVTADTTDDWFPSEAVFPEYRALFIRAVEAPGEPPVDCALPDWIAVSPGAGSVSGGGEQAVEVTFDAGDLLPGEYQANLCIASNDPANGLVVIPVALTVEEFVVVPGELSLEPAALNFGDVSTGMSSTMSLTVSNTADPGAESLELAAIDLVDGSQAFQISGGDCAVGMELAPKQSCEVEVRFSPDAEIDYFGAVVVTTADSQDGTVDVSGTGAEPPGNDIFTDRFEEGGP